MDYEYHRLRAQLAVLRDVATEYPTASITNIIQQIETRIKNFEENGEKESN